MGVRRRPTSEVTRRQMLAATATAVAAVPLVAPGVAAVVEAAATRFFTPAELAMADALTEIIIPADAHSPGARAAKVAEYIDARLAEAFDGAARTTWRNGMKAVDALSQQLHQRPFMRASPAERTAVVARMAVAEAAPKTDAERFFATVKRATVDAYYTSKIGIHQEMEYKGNTLLQEFVGQ